MIGAVGHRDLVPEDLASARARVREFLEGLIESYPHTPMHCYTGLAGGADQPVANIALDLGIPIVAVLPGGAETFRATLDEDAKHEYDRLLLHVVKVIELPAELTSKTRRAEKDELSFVALGNVLSDRSQVLLALFDGDEGMHHGGTAWIVRRKIKGLDRIGIDLLDSPQTGLACVIPVRRKTAFTRAGRLRLSIKSSMAKASIYTMKLFDRSMG